ncbi:MAG: hypothetical protein HMLKMBBP_00117 [Planctomycetes bacterium]|nr:hypothetical protein [Planctomycetota bacterium]
MTITPDDFRRTLDQVRASLGEVVVGQAQVIDELLLSLLAGGHVLLEGVPGVGKTLLVRSVATALGLEMSRIQFTPDLMPADVVGTEVLSDAAGGMRFDFRPGPVFGQVVLADEVNRATPKTQSALLQAMEEAQVTVARRTHALPRPFFVLATQNPIEMEGTYPLPEAQLDRFLMKITVSAPGLADLLAIVDRTTSGERRPVARAASPEQVLAMQALVREVPVAPHLRELIGKLVLATHPAGDGSPPLVRRVVRHGASPRAAQGLALAAKARALSRGRVHVSEDDIRALAPSVLRHRILIGFEGDADGVTSDQVVRDVLTAVKA